MSNVSVTHKPKVLLQWTEVTLMKDDDNNDGPDRNDDDTVAKLALFCSEVSLY